eukprot:TRINITY_DN10342_c0_g1_i1.p1 TRINITY_DN10342_c0_g1~~TRINITY_DN10342_c0_g1_i1.p1  ORF type:complete len:623 (+),score=60.23 TRINITY_DN10342_c0_g1_i1:12-1880(+)
MEFPCKGIFSDGAPLFVFGSLAWSKSHFCGRQSAPRDIDCIMRWSQFVDFVYHCRNFIVHIAEVRVPNAAGRTIPIKFLVVFRGFDRLEIEILDCLPSAAMHVMWAGTIEDELVLRHLKLKDLNIVHVPAPNLLAFKLSHMALPLDWRKTASDVAEMLDAIGKPLKLILTQPEKVDYNAGDIPVLKEFLSARLAENVAVNYTLQNHAPSCVKDSSDSRVTLKIREDLDTLVAWTGARDQFMIFWVEATPGEPQTFSTPFLPIKMSFLKFNALTHAQKRHVLTEITILVAVHYFLLDRRLINAADLSSCDISSIAKESYLCALETICTRCFAVPEIATNLVQVETSKVIEDYHFRKWWDAISIYNGTVARQVHAEELKLLGPDLSPTLATKSIEDLLRSWGTINLSDHSTFSDRKLNFPSSAEISALGIPALDPLVNLIFAEISHLIQVPPLMETFAAKYISEMRALDSSLARSTNASFIDDVWTLILKSYLHDHASVQRLRQVNRKFKKWLTDGKEGFAFDIWSRLLVECWLPKTLTKHKAQGCKPEAAESLFKRIWRAKWKKEHKEAYVCDHCSKVHFKISRDDWYAENAGEFTREFCPCPQCHDSTPSWKRCPYHSLYII